MIPADGEPQPGVALTVASAERARVEASLRRVHGLAYWLDDAFEIPLIRRRIGLDPIIGLIPAAGDWVTWLFSAYILVEAVRLEAPVRLLFRMAGNIALDLVVGTVPLLGDIADAAIKANRKNARLLAELCGATVSGATIHFVADPSLRERSNALSRFAAAGLLFAGLFAMLLVPIALVAWLLSKL